MTTELRYTLLSDGSSDASLLPILDWLLIQNGVNQPIQSQWADLRALRTPPKNLAGRIRLTLELFPCNLLFIHRDAENMSYSERATEIHGALQKLTVQSLSPSVFVIPVRMTEAWLLFDEAAIRFAAGNQSGRNVLDLPDISSLEQIADPKSVLYNLILEASNLRGRRLKRLNPSERIHRITSYANDYSPLRNLDAFRSLEADIFRFVNEYWRRPS